MSQSGIAGFENNARVHAFVGTEPGKETKPNMSKENVMLWQWGNYRDIYALRLQLNILWRTQKDCLLMQMSVSIRQGVVVCCYRLAKVIWVVLRELIYSCYSVLGPDSQIIIKNIYIFVYLRINNKFPKHLRMLCFFLRIRKIRIPKKNVLNLCK